MMCKIDSTLNESSHSVNPLVTYSLTNYSKSVNSKTRQVLRQIIVFFALLFALTAINAQPIKAFPTAIGAGAYTTGGRGKPVYIVTNLNNSGTGSFRQALENTRATDGGIITFAVSGTIVLTSKLTFRDQNNITIAGQTAPSGGITIVSSNSVAKFELFEVSNFIIRYVRFRPDYPAFPSTELDALNISNCSNYIVDHCSISWGTDENADSGNGSYFTWQRNLFAESNKTGMIMGAEVDQSEKMSFINNMFYNCNKRFPNYQSDGRVDVINNVVWNFRTLISVSQGGHKLNHIGNYYQYFRDSPAADEGRWNLWYPFNQTIGGPPVTNYPSIYTSGNYISNVLTNPNADNYFTWRWEFNPVESPYAGAPAHSQLTLDFKANTQFPLLGSPFTIQSAVDSFENVRHNVGVNARLDQNGSRIEEIDGPDSIYLNNVQNDIRVNFTPESNLSTAHFNAFQASVSTQPINMHPLNFDTNNDGIPNQWVINKGFNVNDDITTYVWPSGYVGIEEYLNQVDNSTIARDDINQTPVNTILNGDVSTNDSDPEGDNQIITNVSADTNGNGVSDNLLSIGTATSIFGTNNGGLIRPAGIITISANGSYTYSPANDFIGTIEIPYTVTDDNDTPTTDHATLYIETLPNSITGCSGEITSFPYSEGFEDTLGDWTQSSSDDLDWIADRDGTPSNGTGPSSASEGTYYVYVEASGSGTGFPTKQALLNSPCFNLSGLSEANFSFKYHQYGSADMGNIDLEASGDNGASWSSLWNSTGNLGDSWLTADVDLGAYVGGSVKLRFNRVTGSTWEADLAIDDVSLSVVNTVINNGGDACSGEITSFPYSEGFENTLGAWAQSSTDDIDWTVDVDGTPSSGTGPSSAFQGLYYAYVEASGSGTGFPTKQALLNSPCFNLSGLSEANFSFKYHQYGAVDMGSIDLEASDDNGANWTSIWNSSGNKGNTWLTADVDLGAYVGGSVQLRFNRVTGSTWEADLAIDEVSLSAENTVVSGCSGEITSFPYSEGFENTLGAWTQSLLDDMDWAVDAAGTPSSGTGPSSASQGTYYAYVEASNNLNKQALLNSPCFNLSGLSGANFSFKYHQFGSTEMGRIDLEASGDNGVSWTSIWNSTGNLGDSWLTANVNLGAYVGGSVKLRFNRVTGSTWEADIAIDDVHLSQGGNSADNGCSGGIISYPYSEGFENTLGAWTQSTSDDIDWTIHAAGTPSDGTGPSSASQGSYYVYVEASGNNTGYPTKQAVLNSPCFNLSAQTSATFSFKYHQFGASDMGTINLEASDDNGVSWARIWKSSGNLGDSWQLASVNLSAYTGGSLQLRFNRVTGNSWQADIAIDNVSLSTSMTRVQATTTAFDNVKKITLYPNPVKENILHIKSDYTKMSYEIYNMVGQLVSKGNVKNNIIYINNLNVGIYRITFSSEGEIITKQFIKQ